MDIRLTASAKKIKIVKKQQFDAVFSYKKRMSTDRILIYYRPNNNEFSRLGIITSKKNARLAHDRNRIRRILKEQFRTLYNQIPSCDFVVISKKNAAEAQNHEIRECFTRLIQKITRKCEKLPVN